MKEQLKQIILQNIESIQSRKKGKNDPEFALFNEIWHFVFLDIKMSLIELKSEGKIETIDTVNQSGFKIKSNGKID